MDDAIELAVRARAAGVDTTLLVEADMVHAYATFLGLWPRAEDALRTISELIGA